MSNSTVNFIMSKASSNFTTSAFYEVDVLDFYVLGFSFLMGVPTNSYVMWLIITGTGIGAASDFLTLNLSICGLFFSVNSLLILLTNWFPLPSLLELSSFFFGLAITGSPLFQCLICIERYIAVVHPVIFLKTKPLRYRVICCAVAWIITLGSCIICMISYILSTLYMYVWFFSVQFLLYLSVQMFCCVSVLKALKHSGPGEKVREREEENHMKRRAFNLILLTSVNTIITYVPFTVTGLLTAVTTQLFQTLWSVSYFLFMLGNLAQPVMFLHRSGNLSCLSMCKK